MKSKLRKLFVLFITCIAFLCNIVPPFMVNAEGDGTQTVLDISQYSIINIEADKVTCQNNSGESTTITADPDGYIITGTETTYSGYITISSGIHNITLDNVKLNSFTTSSPVSPSSFAISPGATVNLTLIGDNILDSSTTYEPGILMPDSATLIITEESIGTLTALAGRNSAAIGGGYRNMTCGTVIINGGTIAARGNENGPGIGSSGWSDHIVSGGTITINGGNITAEAGNSVWAGAGIGGGYGDGGSITITGGTVTARGGNWGAGIGAGVDEKGLTSGGNITITGGIINAAGGDNGADIGGAHTSSGGNITISGGIVNAVTNGIGAGLSSDGSGTLSSDESGTAWIHAHSVGIDKTGFTSGVLFEGTAGTVYGQPIIPEDATVPIDMTLTVPENQTLTMIEGKTLTVDGTLINNGTIIGSVVKNTDGMITCNSHSSYVHHEAIEPTCITDGDREYWSCNICGKLFGDEARETEITSEDIFIPIAPDNHSYEENKCSLCGAYEDNVGARVYGHSLSLDGNIGVNFYMELADNIINDPDAYMQFTLPNGDMPKIFVSEAEPAELDGAAYYVFSCEVAAKEMTSEITAQIITGDGTKGKEYTYTVQDYAKYILENSEKYTNSVSLVKAMLNYGGYSQIYFDYNTGNMANSILTEDEKALAETLDLSRYTYTKSGEEAGITYYGSQLSLESMISVRHYFRITGDKPITDYIFLYGENNISMEVKEGSGMYYVEIPDIPAKDLGSPLTVTVGGLRLSYSAMSYANAALNWSGSKDTLKDTVKALYAYNEAAIAYFESKQ